MIMCLIVCMILNTMSLRMNGVQVWIGFFLLANGVKGEVLNFFSQLYLSCSYDTLMRRLDAFSKEQKGVIKLLVRGVFGLLLLLLLISRCLSSRVSTSPLSSTTSTRPWDIGITR